MTKYKKLDLFCFLEPDFGNPDTYNHLIFVYPWFGIEQEYTLTKPSKVGMASTESLGFDANASDPAPQGPYYCCKRRLQDVHGCRCEDRWYQRRGQVIGTVRVAILRFVLKAFLFCKKRVKNIVFCFCFLKPSAVTHKMREMVQNSFRGEGYQDCESWNDRGC